MEWWTLLRWALRGLLVLAVFLLSYIGILGLASASSTSEDGAELAIVVGGAFLFLAAIAFWWLCIELRRD
jgi:hypothetical protein